MRHNEVNQYKENEKKKRRHKKNRIEKTGQNSLNKIGTEGWNLKRSLTGQQRNSNKI